MNRLIGILVFLLFLLSPMLAGKHSGAARSKSPTKPAEVTVSWAKRALQGFNMRVWISNQMTLGLQAWDCGFGDCIPQWPSLGLEYPLSTDIEHLYGAG